MLRHAVSPRPGQSLPITAAPDCVAHQLTFVRLNFTANPSHENFALRAGPSAALRMGYARALGTQIQTTRHPTDKISQNAAAADFLERSMSFGKLAL